MNTISNELACVRYALYWNGKHGTFTDSCYLNDGI